MRIIAGSARGRRLDAPAGPDTRPTADRVRESLFSIVAPRLSGARVLDLFAGSGALGLEALSRGAERAVFVDSAAAARQAVRRNIEALSFGDRSTLLSMDALAAVARLRGERFDIIFIDPPYAMRTDALFSAVCDAKLLSADGLIVYEHGREANPDFLPGAAGQPPTQTGAPFATIDRRRYGDTVVTFLRNRTEEAE